MAVVTHFKPSDTQSEIVRRYYVCDTEAELPPTGNLEADKAYTKDTDRLWAWNGSIWFGVAGVTAGRSFGARATWISATQISIDPCQLRDSTDTFNLVMTSTDTVDITVAADRDFTEAANTWYYIHVIGSSTGAQPTRGFFSSSATAPILPSGYDKFRRVTANRNNGSSNLIKFFQTGSGNDRRYFYDDARANLQVLAGGSSATYAAVSLAAFVPPVSMVAHLVTAYDSTGPTDIAELRPTGSTVTTPVNFLRPGVAAPTGISDIFEMYVGNPASVDYRVTVITNDLDIFIAGFVDEI